MQVDRPNWRDGFADLSLKDLSDAPEQWLGDVASYAPFLGVQGNMLYDLSGYGNHVTLANMDLAAAWGVSPLGSGLIFDGTDDVGQVLSISSAVRFTTNSQFSVFMLVNRDSSANTFSFMASTPDAYGISINNGLFQPYVGNYINSTYTIGLNIMTHIGFTWNNGAVACYANGVLRLATTSADTFSAPTQFRIGAYDASTFSFKGLIDDIRIYNRALSAAEVQAIYADTFAKYRLRRRIWTMSFDAADVSQFRRRPPR